MYKLNTVKIRSLPKVFSCLPGLIVFMNLYSIEEGQDSSLTIKFELFDIIKYYVLKNSK